MKSTYSLCQVETGPVGGMLDLERTLRARLKENVPGIGLDRWGRQAGRADKAGDGDEEYMPGTGHSTKGR